MVMIQARLIDAESRREGEASALIKQWLKRLKSVLYDLEDLFEEVSFAEKEEKEMNDEGKLNKVVRKLTLQSPRLKSTRKVSQQFDIIMMKLEGIRSDMNGLNLREYTAIEQHGTVSLSSERETHSFIPEDEVIGREEDKKAIVEMLLNTSPGEENIGVIPIIGMGGLGKTTLAQLCYNDRDVQSHFELKAWACISETSSLKDMALIILKSVSDNGSDQLCMEEIQSRLRGAVNDKRYLLVLDDVWDEDREKWLRLRLLLTGGKQGSRIIVTSRSGIVALNMGTFDAYELRGLEEERSWVLFKRLAFKEGQQERNPNLTSIGREIVKKCANVPLAIRTIAALLYRKDSEEEWMNFRDSELGTIQRHENGSNNIMSTLKLSYYHLPSPLKQCFAYCSLFPKDYKIDKQQLIWLWIAHGFVRSSGSQRPEDVGHAYFTELLRRCFFQDVLKDEFGRIEACKMHDLLHDVACEVGDECLTVGRSVEKINGTIRHLSCSESWVPWKAPSCLLAAKKMRSLVFTGDKCPHVQNLDEICSRLRYLRALNLNNSSTKSINCESLDWNCRNPSFLNCITELKHLRYLKLSVSSESLPDCITRLQNLQVLDLRFSTNLIELPERFSKLLNLRHLHIGSVLLIDMPPRFGDLTSLQTLDIFVVGENNGLDAVGNMSLTGELTIRFREARRNAASEAKMANMKDKNLYSLRLEWRASVVDTIGNNEDEYIECLQLPQSLKKLKVLEWKGVKFPRWGMDQHPCLLPNLVEITIKYCGRCQQLPPFSQLPLLRSLYLSGFHELEYMENGVGLPNSSEAASTAAASSVAFFPSLEELSLEWFPELKGWWRMDNVQNHQHHQSVSQAVFPCLSKLKIQDCRKLVSMPVSPQLRKLEVEGIQVKLLHEVLMTGQEAGEASPSLSFSSSTSSILSELKELKIIKVEGLEVLSINNNMPPMESLDIVICSELMSLNLESPFLRRLLILGCSKLKELEFGEDPPIWQGLQSLSLWGLPKLEWIPKGLCCPTTLDYLRIQNLPNLRALPDSFSDHAQLQTLAIGKCPTLSTLPNSLLNNLTQLRRLKIMGESPELMSFLDSLDDLLCLTLLEVLEIWDCPNITALPDWVCRLLHLQKLEIWDCPKMSTLPDSFGNLTSLQSLAIGRCPELIRRCQKPNGDYCPLIQRIPDVSLRNY